MSESLATSDWVAERGAKWSAHISGMEAMLAPIDEPLIQALRLDTPLRIAEIGCGGGGTTLEILRRAPEGSFVHGFDIAPPLIEMASARTRPEERAITFALADMATTAPDAPYDRLASRFGVMFFDDPPAAFANLRRWLSSGGRFAFAVWGPPSENPWMTSVRDVVAGLVEMPPSEPSAPGLFRYADAGKLLTALDQAGFGDLAMLDWRGTLPIGGELPAAEAAHFALASFSSFAELLAAAGYEALTSARQALTERFSRHQQEGAVRMGACVHIVTGVR